MKYSAVCLFSGGLDSWLAYELVRRQGIDVYAVWISTCFQRPYVSVIKRGKDLKELEKEFGKRYGIDITVLSISNEFFEILRSPQYGFGRNCNPCIDCKIAMIKKAKGFMYDQGADFIITGEVLGQRPLSQQRNSLELIENEAGVKGVLLRPLSAKLLPLTKAEEEGIIDRDKLYGFSGRGRKSQIKLAKELGITNYPQPAGGCLLTEGIFANRVRDLLDHNGVLEQDTSALLSTGRHFRISERIKLICGRNYGENLFLEQYKGKRTLIIPETVPGPSGLVQGDLNSNAEKELCCSIIAQYATKKKGAIDCRIFDPDGTSEVVNVGGIGNSRLSELRI